MAIALLALTYLVDMIFGEFPCKHPVKTGINLIVLSLLAAGAVLR
jgi:hypothetical protein